MAALRLPAVPVLAAVALAAGCPGGALAPSGSSPSPAPTFRPGTPPPLGIATSRPRAFSDAYQRARGAVAQGVADVPDFDPAGFQFVGADRSKIDTSGLAPAGGRWCFFFYSPGSAAEITVLLTYGTADVPVLSVAESDGTPSALTQIDPSEIRVDSDAAIARRPGLPLAADNNVRMQMDEGPEGKLRPAYLFVAPDGIAYAVDARTGSAP